MIHGTKMVLVPQELAKALNGDLPQPPAPVGSYSAMDTEMIDILKNKNLDTFTKWKQYTNVLQRYMAKVERTKNALTVNYESDDDGGDDAAAQQPPLNNINIIKKANKKVNSTVSKIDDGASGPSKLTKKATSKTKIAALKYNSTTLPEILNKLTKASEKKQAQALFDAMKSSSHVIVTKTGILKIKRKNVGQMEPLIRYKVKGESGKAPAGWAEFSEFIVGLKALPKNKTASPTRLLRRTSKLVGNGKSWLTY